MHSRVLRAGFISVMALAMPMVAQAQSVFDHSDPGAGTTASGTPTSVTVYFTKDLSNKDNELQVVDAAGSRVDVGDSHVDGSRRNVMVVGLRPSLPNGVYYVRWTTDADNDPVDASGEFAFGVGMPAPTAKSQSVESQASGVPFEVTGTVVSHTANTIEFLTSEITGVEQTITVNVKKIKKSNISDGDALTLLISPRSGDTAEAWDVVMAGSRTEQAEFGSRGEFATSNEASEILNRADDDEARAKDKDHRGKED